MRWFCKSLLWASLGCFSASASAQDVSLGRPRPLPADAQAGPIRAVSAFMPIPASVVRAYQDDEPKSLALPKDLPLLPEPRPSSYRDTGARPTQSVLPADKELAVETDKDGKAATPAETRTVSTSATITVLPEEGRNGVLDWTARWTNGGDGRFYARGEYLLWWTRGMNLPPLVTTAPATDPEATRAALGFGGTQIIYGNSTTSTGPTSGARFTLGYSLDECGLFALEGSYFFAGRKDDNAFFSSDQFPVLGRPFFDLNDGVQGRQLTASPGLVPGDLLRSTGAIAINTSSTLMGAELNLRARLWSGCNYNISGIVGARYLNLSEQLNITESVLIRQDIPVNPPNVPIRAGDNITVFDRFHTRNQFFGGQLGVAGDWQLGRWFLEGGVKLAIGTTLQSVDIDGGQRIISADGRIQTFQGGLYAVPSNIGHRSQSHFGYAPELNLKLGYNLNDNIRLFVGYDFLYWSSVIRASDQIDQVLDLNQVPNSGAPFPAANQVRPIVPFRTSSYWAQGVNAGVEFRY